MRPGSDSDIPVGGRPMSRPRRPGPILAAAASGAVAAGVAIAVGELAAGLLPGAPSLVISIGDLIVDLQPPGAKDLVVGLFGTNDKTALNVAILVVTLGIAALLGVAGRTRWRTPVIGFSIAAAVAVFAALREPLAVSELSILTVLVALGAALGVLRGLLAMTGATWAAAGSTGGGRQRLGGAGGEPSPGVSIMPDWDRRRFLVLGGALAVGSLAIGALGRSLLVGRSLDAGTGAAAGGGPVPTLPPPMSPAAPLAPGASFIVPGITPIVMPNDRFYRIDTALLVPRVDVSTWRVRIWGMVDHEVVLTYAELLAMPLFEQYVTIACVSNHVGEDLVGNAKWTGVHLRDMLAMAGVQAGATQVVGRSVDGFTVGFPTAWAMDTSRDPMIALGMNGDPLPAEHGYPARLIVPGLYGYVSATKWLSEIQLTTLEAFDAYWVPLGWAKEAPILTQSRIDVPHDGDQLAAGPVVIAGVAWAPDRGVSRVEVRIDDGAWQPAALSAAISRATWVQWRVDWSATSGTHRIEVRATDGTGEVQTADETPPPPDGARGHHHVEVRVG